MLGILMHTRPEGGFVLQLAAMTVEVGACPLFHRRAQPPCRREIIAPIGARHHGEGIVTDLGNEETVMGAGKQSPRRGRGGVVDVRGGLRRVHAALPSAVSDVLSSAVTSSSTASE